VARENRSFPPPLQGFRGLLLIGVSLALCSEAGELRPDPPKVCSSCDEWNAPRKPFRVFGNTYFVGPDGLGAVLVASDQGLILLDGGLAQSAAVIDAGIRELGFRTGDIRLILSSHEHFDHAGGIAALQRATGAVVAASAPAVPALEKGGLREDDPQLGFGPSVNSYPPIPSVRAVSDGETLRVGPLAVTAHFTPGHTSGSTTWTWRSCGGDRCLDVVYADSLNAVSAPGFRFTGGPGSPSRVPTFRKSMERVAALPCDILLAVHPSFARMGEKLEQRAKAPGTNPFIEPGACRTYAAEAAVRLDKRVAEETAATR